MINEYGTFGGIKVAEKTEVFGENASRCHFLYQKFHMT
jgi:hypothetical protein